MKFQLFILFAVSLFFLNISCGEKEEAVIMFTKVDNDASGLHFVNQLYENDSINILDNEFVYNGAGVGLGDLNGDGLEDIFLAGNQVDNKLFLNQGLLSFRDVSEPSGIAKPDSLLWSSGVSIIDINLDGKMDIYVCNTFFKGEKMRKNLLYINQGNTADQIPEFREMAEEYGIADTSYSSHAQFFDYDNDGDLDLFIGVNRIEGINPNQFSPLTDDGTSLSRDRLYENRWKEGAPHPVFEEVSEKAGIRYHGYSHSTLIHDFNSDGWMDIYVANDFLSNDLIYINNQDGSFTNKAGEIFKHFSLSSMGSDLADINNDGMLDLFTTEMQPYYNKRKKLFQGPSSYQKEIFTRKFQYEYQYTRNTLQLNMGTNPENKLSVFGEMGMLAGVQETDWSWAPLFADYDNDGWQDLLITNGFPKDVTDRDFGDFRITASRLISKEKLIDAIPEIKIPNFIFRNRGDLTFEDATEAWGLNFGTYSNGAAYGDLDNDGDLDLVINNINDPVLLMENHAREISPDAHFLRVKLKGPDQNPAAIGAVVSIYTQSGSQKQSLLSGRGYLSQPELTLHFGLGKTNRVDSLVVQWPGGNMQTVTSVEIDKTNKLAFAPNRKGLPLANPSPSRAIVAEASSKYGLQYLSRDIDFIDFNFQRTLPHKFSQYGPSLAVGDVNNDGREDLFVGGSRNFGEQWFMQQSDGTFISRDVSYKNSEEQEEEDAGTLLFDADMDGDLDLYIARGSAQYPKDHPYYQDLLLINDGSGNFTIDANSLPQFRSNSSAVKAADFDQDGDLDLFVGSRVLPMSYPLADRSFLLRNDSKEGQVRFTDVTVDISPPLEFAGLISDALWTDFNGDSWPDLILAGEWMPLRFFENNKGKFREITSATGIANKLGWWNSLAASDLDNDGDMDYIAGNHGQNLYFQGTEEHPVRIYAKDLDKNGMIDPLISYYLRDSLGVKREYLYHPWQDVVKQFVGIRKYFNSFGEFGEATLPEMFPEGLLDDAEVKTFNYMHTSWVENLGGGKFALHPLPAATQTAPVYGIAARDLDGNGYQDLILVGNDFGMEVQQGRADAFNGQILLNKGKGNFEAMPLEKSHFYVPGDAKSLVSINQADNKTLLVAGQNNDSLKVFEINRKHIRPNIKIRPDEVSARIFREDGSMARQEFYYGDTFLSQSGRFLEINASIRKIEFFDNLGRKTRTWTAEK